MKIIVSKKVVDGAQINVLHKLKDSWFVVSEKELFDENSFEWDDFVEVDEEYLFERIPNLKGKLDQKNETTINIDYKTGEINVNPKHFHLGAPTHKAKSTRQVNAGFNFFHYLFLIRGRYKKILWYIVGLWIAAWMFGWFFYIPIVLIILYHVMIVFKTRDMYYSGDLNPGIVIDAQTNKMATLTDMSMGLGHYPIIRIRRYPLPKKYRVNGMKIPIAGMYQNTEEYSHWNYFESLPIPTGIRNEKVIQSKISAIPTREWVELNNEIKKFDGIPKEGYYPINIEGSDWKDIDIDKIVWMQFGEEK